MNNCTSNLKRFFLIPIFVLVFFSANGQNGIIGTGFGANDWSTTNNFLSGAGSSRIFTATPNGTGNQYFRLVRNWSANYTQFGPSGCVDTDWTNPGVVYGMSDCGSGAFYINCPNTTDNYVFKTPNGDVSKDLLYFRIQGAVRNVSTVTQFPLVTNARECHATTVTATLDGALASGQDVYLRYTNDGYVTSTVVKLTGSGTIYKGTIPSSLHSSGANVSYYVFTSGDSNVASNGSNADLYTINLNNNGGSNYSYTVAAGGTTTFVPDDNFEQALIDLGLDCTMDNQVFTNNISGIIALDVSGKSISNLTGIQDFTALKDLRCSSNTLPSLTVSTLTNLEILYCDNNLLTALDVHLSPNLNFLDCQSNTISNLNISGLTKLVQLICWINNLSTVNVSANPGLIYLDVDDNDLTSLNVTGTSLTDLYCSNNSLTVLDVRGLSNLSHFECTGNSSLTCILVDNVADAILKTTTVDPDPLAGGAFLWAKDATATYSYCNCDLTTTWNGSSWSNGTPTTGTYAAIISGNYNQADPINACSLTITSNATVTIPSGFNVTLNAPIIVESGSSFTLSNNANLIQTNKNSVNSGAITVKRDSNPLYRGDYTMWSSPTGTTQTMSNFSPLTTTGRFYEYNSGTNLYNAVVNTTPFSKGKGFLIRMPNEDPANLGGGSPYSLGNAAITYNGVFTGIPNNGHVDLGVLPTASFVAVGNPYPSFIDADLFLSGNTTSGTLYFWRRTNGSTTGPGTAYATYTSLGGVGTGSTLSSATPNGTIQVGQGFIVNTGAGTAINFENTMRVANHTSQFFKTKQVVVKDRLWINLTNATGAFSQMLLGYMDGATTGVDNGIDGKYINDAATALTSEINNEEYVIQGRPAFSDTDVVNLNFKTDVAGDFTIAKDHVDGLFASAQDIFLVDATTGKETNLQNEAYTFTSAIGTFNTRFKLTYKTSETLNVKDIVFDENSISVYKQNGVLNINAGKTTMKNVKVFDLAGRLILEQKAANATTTTLKNLAAGKQAVLIQITSDENKVVTKKAIN